MIPKISIIIPVYNVESYLHYCINSILRQTYKNFEVLLIDDGSTDHSGDICDELASNDNRIQVFHKTNGGVSSARNLGLKEANGEWICFVDSDDWIEDYTLEHIIKETNNNIDFIQFGFKQINENNKIIMKSNLPLESLKIDKTTYFSNTLFHSAICGYLIKTNIIRQNDLNFPENIKYAEDQVFIFKALMCSNNIYILNEHLYYYRYREGSAMNSSLTFSRAEDHLKVIENISEFTKNKDFKLSILHKFVFKNLILNYIRIGLESSYNLIKVKSVYSEYCKKNDTNDIYKYCKHYNYYHKILRLYIYINISMVYNKLKNIIK